MSDEKSRGETEKAATRARPAARGRRRAAAPPRSFDVLAVADDVLRALPLPLLAVDRRQRIVLANDRLLELFGARRADVLDQPVASLLPGVVLSAEIGADGVARARLEAGDGDGRRVAARRVDGVRFAVEAEARPWQIGEQQLVFLTLGPEAAPSGVPDRDELLRIVLSGLPAMVSVKDRHGRYILVNDYQAEILGIAPEMAVGRTTSELIGSGAGAAIDALDRQVATGAGLFFTVEETFKDRTGRDSVWLTTKSALRDENGEIDKVFSVSIDISEKKLLEEQAEALVNYDALTGLPNRSLFLRRLHEAVRHARRARSRIAIVVMDLDNLKEVERAEGEGAVEHVIRRAAIRLSSTIRETDAVARPGNESFAVLINQVSDPEEAAAEGARFAESLAEPFQLRSQVARLQVSHGVAVYPDDGRDEHELMEAADIAINRSRTRHRQARLPLQAASDDQSRRRALHNGLRRALEHGQLRLVFLPEVDLATGVIVGAEALTRWDHPEHGAIAPAELLDVAESSELMDAFTEWSLREACQTAARWADGPLARIAVAVNLSASQFFYPDLVDLVADTLYQADCVPARFAVEVDELAAMQDPDLAANITAELAEAGIATSLDRFGAQATSLAFIEQLKASSLKIDRGFMAEWRTRGALIRAAATLGNSLGKRIVAAGIETVDQLRLAREAGCAGGQGYLFSRPVGADALLALARERNGRVTLPA